ncbi:heparan-alpha-glucosaminide N-acetyltransferase [Trifolium repens]|nr:heparan-alpha-glucosaminide N-acetyltransferase [Trifolium repens]
MYSLLNAYFLSACHEGIHNSLLQGLSHQFRISVHRLCQRKTMYGFSKCNISSLIEMEGFLLDWRLTVSLFNLSIFRIKKTIWKVLVVSSEAELVSAKELPKKAKRIPSLDIFRGLTVAVLLLPLHISLHCFFCLLLYIVVPACSKC